MLTHLRVQNFALIEDVEFDLEEGLNVLSGETGAGKSLILGAVNLALGGRVSRELTVDPERPVQVDLLFDVAEPRARKALSEAGFLSDNSQELLLSRRVLPNGRSVNRMNDQIVTAACMQQAAAILIDVHGQHEHQSLLDSKRHIDLLDRFDERTGQRLDAIGRLLAEKNALEAERKKWLDQAGDKDRILSLMQDEAQEIDDAHLKPGEEPELQAAARKARSAVQIQQACAEAYQSLSGDSGYDSSGTGLLETALGRLQQIENLDPEQIGPMIATLSEAISLAEQTASDIRRYGEDTETDPETLSELESRLDLWDRLKRKYGSSYEKIMAYRDELTESIRKIENINDTLAAIETKLAAVRKKLDAEADVLTALRTKAAAEVAKAVTDNLKTLQFQDPEFAVSITPRDEVGSKGRDQVRFMIRTNVGDSLRPLDKIASGGEISRIMLAVKTVLADRDDIPTLIFDEIDTGISGRTAQRVAEKLSLIGRYHQIICVTHSPQIAAMADTHFCIEKTVRDGHAVTDVRELSAEESVAELARMLGGAEMSETAVANARDMKEQASGWKRKI